MWRKMMDTAFYRDSYAVHLALHLVYIANHADKSIIFNKQPLLIKRGSMVTGRHALSLATGIAPSTVRNKIDVLKNAHFLDIKSDSKFSIITIRNYETYQDIKRRSGQRLGQQKDSRRTAEGQPKDTNNTLEYTNNTLERKLVGSIPAENPPEMPESKEKKSKVNNNTPLPPKGEVDRFSYLKEPAFVRIFNDYLEARRKRPTPRARELILEKLHKYDIHTAADMLEQSIQNGWTGIFPIKNEHSGYQKKSSPGGAEARILT